MLNLWLRGIARCTTSIISRRSHQTLVSVRQSSGGYSNEHGLFDFQSDVAHVFVRTKLGPKLYMNLPAGCSIMPGKVVRLNRSLHGLKQSGWQWFGLPVETVVAYAMAQCRADPCVFRMAIEGKVLLHPDCRLGRDMQNLVSR